MFPCLREFDPGFTSSIHTELYEYPHGVMEAVRVDSKRAPLGGMARDGLQDMEGDEGEDKAYGVYCCDEYICAPFL